MFIRRLLTIVYLITEYLEFNFNKGNKLKNIINVEASRGAGTQSVTVNATRVFYPHSRNRNIYLNVYFHFFTLVSSSATQHAISKN